MTDLDILSGVEFEKLIAQLLMRMGFHAQVTKSTGDGGIDVVATSTQALTGGRFLVQCKRYAPASPVGAAAVREFYGALTADRQAVKGILITTSGFTEQAQGFARGLPVELIGRDRLQLLLEQYDLHPEAASRAQIHNWLTRFGDPALGLQLEVSWTDGEAVVSMNGEDLSPRLSDSQMIVWLTGLARGLSLTPEPVMKERTGVREQMETLRKATALIRQVTPEQVEAALGAPETRVDSDGKTIYTYKELTIEFHDGKVTDVR